MYQSNSLNMNSYMIHGSSIEAKSLEFLKILSEKAWVAIRYLPPDPKMKERGVSLKVGDVIKFGRVPFIVKESSCEKDKRKDDSNNDFYSKQSLINESLDRNMTELDPYPGEVLNDNQPENIDIGQRPIIEDSNSRLFSPSNLK